MAALEQLLGNGSEQSPMQAVALAEMGIDPRVIKSMMPTSAGDKKDYLAANVSSIGSSPAAIKAAQLAGLITEQEASELLDAWYEGKDVTQVANPTRAYSNRLELNPTENSLVAADIEVGAPVAGVSGAAPVTEKPIKDVSQNGDGTATIFYVDGTTETIRDDSQDPMVRNEKGGMTRVGTDSSMPQKQNRLEAFYTRTLPLPPEKAKVVETLRTELEGTKTLLSEMENATRMMKEAPQEVFGDKQQTSQFLQNVGVNTGGIMGEAMSMLGKGLQSPEAAIVNQTLLGQKLLQMKALGGSDTEKEFLWLSQNLPSAFSNPTTATEFMDRMTRAMRISARVKEKKAADAVRRIPGTKTYFTDTPEGAAYNYYDEACRELGYEPLTERDMAPRSIAADAPIDQLLEGL
jgi:hypothetical protein